ncbi:hypothetical protein SAMN04488561_1055 [Jiangella alba]|uniref:Transcriptional regulator, AbiEi antitoxin, Type IV TA system n=1 Tax=Jiangella alba TaxID=561176 RepID=A0A1H5I3V9_9ACTN|nr:hypothetical protein SAMN04488561_1055 [Jiangella alba]
MSTRRSPGFVRVHRTSRLPQAHFWVNRDETTGALPVPHELVLDSIAPTARPGVIPRVPAARAVIDAVVLGPLEPSEWTPARRDAGLRGVRALTCEVVQRRKSGLAELRVEARAAGRRGSALARVALADIEAGCRSAPECELRDLVRRSRILPEPHWNRPLPGVAGPAAGRPGGGSGADRGRLRRRREGVLLALARQTPSSRHAAQPAVLSRISRANGTSMRSAFASGSASRRTMRRMASAARNGTSGETVVSDGVE